MERHIHKTSASPHPHRPPGKQQSIKHNDKALEEVQWYIL